MKNLSFRYLKYDSSRAMSNFYLPYHDNLRTKRITYVICKALSSLLRTAGIIEDEILIIIKYELNVVTCGK